MPEDAPCWVCCIPRDLPHLIKHLNWVKLLWWVFERSTQVKHTWIKETKRTCLVGLDTSVTHERHITFSIKLILNQCPLWKLCLLQRRADVPAAFSQCGLSVFGMSSISCRRICFSAPETSRTESSSDSRTVPLGETRRASTSLLIWGAMPQRRYKPSTFNPETNSTTLFKSGFERFSFDGFLKMKAFRIYVKL